MRKIDYRHYICIAITLGFFACTVFIFPHAFGRIIEAVRDFAVSVAYYFAELFEKEGVVTPTVNRLPKVPYFDFGNGTSSPFPVVPIARDWSAFKKDWGAYWKLFFDWNSVRGYFFVLLEVIAYVLYLSPVPIILIVVLKGRFNQAFKTVNNDYEKDSKHLRRWRKLEKCTYVRVKEWLKAFVSFLKEHSKYYTVWLITWAFNFNLITIFLEFFAYLFYMVVSFDFINVYRQVYKLFLDLSPMLYFIPVWVWVLSAFAFLDYLGHLRAFAVLRHRERCNRGLLKERGVVTIACGEMGIGKTAFITDMALSAEVELRDMALEIILECDMKFPNFPWMKLQQDLKTAIAFGVVFDPWSCRRWIRKKYRRFAKNPCSDKLFGYDYKRYGLDYDDKLKLTNVWEVLEDYACAYVVYATQCSLLISNYSIRTDNLFMDLGNFPVWNTDFFARDSRLLDSFSRHSHILDFDMLRLGKKMLDKNPNRNAFGFGVYVVTEIDKERKNTPELKEVSAKSDECNQKNDLFNVMLKMIRHAVVIANRVFIRIIADLQRPDSLGADARELGEVVYIDSKSGMRPVLPFLSPFWLFELIYMKLKSKWDPFYIKAIHVRGDNLLKVYLLKNVMAIMEHFYNRICNLYGSEVLNLEVCRGISNGTTVKKKWYRQSKKIWAKRYATDCLSGIFEARAEINYVGLSQLREYADYMATQDELLAQHSHFQTEINVVRQAS